MHKYSLVLVTILTLFSGCGGGGGDIPNAQLETSGTQNSVTTIESSLQKAGYTDASDVVEIGTNTIAFTYMQGNNKHFVVYDNLNGKILSNIPSFSGDSVISNNESSIIFDNGTKVNIDNYTKAKVETQPKYNNPTSEKTPKEKINDQLSGSQYVSQFVYSPKRQGAAVLIKSEGNTLVGLFLYGLEGSTPIREEPIYDEEEDGLSVTNIRFQESGEVQFIVHAMGWKYYYTYYQSSKYLSETKVIDPGGETKTTDNGSTQGTDAETYIRNLYANDGSDWTSMESFTYSSDNKSDAAVVVANNHAWDFYLYDIPSSGNPYVTHTINPPSHQDEWTNIYNVKKIGGGKITFTGVSKADGRQNYTYYYLENRYENSSSSNNNTSMENLIKIKMQNDGGYVRDYLEFYSINRAVITSKKPNEQWELSVYDTSDSSRAHWLYTISYEESFSNVSKYNEKVITYTVNNSSYEVFDILSRTDLSFSDY